MTQDLLHDSVTAEPVDGTSPTRLGRGWGRVLLPEGKQHVMRSSTGATLVVVDVDSGWL